MDKRVLVDMDGVLVDMHPYMLEKLNEEFGEDYGPNDLVAFDYNSYMPDEHAQFMYDTWHEFDLYDGVEPVAGALEAVRKLEAMYEVVVVSSPMTGHATSKYRWLRNAGFDRKQIVFCSDKKIIRGSILIDDRYKNVEDFPNHTILFDRPWNQFAHHDHRASNWDDVVSLTLRLTTSRAVPHA